MKRLKTGDLVRVMTGSQKGKQGKIKKILVEEQRAIVEGVNTCRVFKRAKGPVDIERSIHLSNLALLSSGKKPEPMKVSYIFKNDKKERVSRKDSKK